MARRVVNTNGDFNSCSRCRRLSARNSLPVNGCVAGLPFLSLPTCRSAFARSTCSHRRSTNSDARRPCLKATSTIVDRGNPNDCPWRPRSAARPRTQLDAPAIDIRHWVCAWAIWRAAYRTVNFSLSGATSVRCAVAAISMSSSEPTVHLMNHLSAVCGRRFDLDLAVRHATVVATPEFGNSGPSV